MQKLNSSASSGHAIFFHNDIKKLKSSRRKKYSNEMNQFHGIIFKVYFPFLY